MKERHISSVTLLVDDYDRAIAYYRDKMGFELLIDSPRDNGDRWVELALAPQTASLRLARARDERQQDLVGAQGGGRVLLVVETDDITRDLRGFAACGVTVSEPLRHETYGKVAVIKDLYGNRWDWIERRR